LLFSRHKVGLCLALLCAGAGCSALVSFDDLTGPAPAADASTDGASSADATAPTDSATTFDAGTQTDASNAKDSGTTTDASDAGSKLDYGKVVLADGPDLYWRFEDALTISDSSGNGRDGTVLGTVTLGAPGAIAGGGKGASFNAGAISGGQILAYTGNASFSVELWAQVATTDYQCFLSRELDPNDGWAFFVYNGPLVLERESSSGSDHATSTPSLNTNVYNHLVGTYDGTTMKVYINGGLVGSQQSTLALPGATAVPFLAGDNNDGGTDPKFTGLLDEIAVYHFALSAAQIQKHYAVGTGAL